MLGQEPCKVSLYSAGGTFIADLTKSLSSGTFNRKKRAVSTFDGSFGIDEGSNVDLEKIDFWATYIVCERDNRDQWSGPVTNVVFNSDTVDVVASDKTVYWSRAQVPSLSYNSDDIALIAEDIISKAFMNNLYGMPELDVSVAGIVLDKNFVSSEVKYVSDALDGLPGLQWTAFGETIYLFALEENPNSIVKITDKDWFGLPSVERAGQIYANGVIVVGKGFVGHAYAPASELEYYGNIFRRYDVPDVASQAGVNNLAMEYLALTRDATYLNTENNAVLSPTLNISLAELIPGNCVDVDHIVGPYSLHRQLRIDGVEVDCITGNVNLSLEPLAVADEETLG